MASSYQSGALAEKARENQSFAADLRFISLSALKLFSCDRRSTCEYFLILLAKRFNNPYYRVLNTGRSSGIEASN